MSIQFYDDWLCIENSYENTAWTLHGLRVSQAFALVARHEREQELREICSTDTYTPSAPTLIPMQVAPALVLAPAHVLAPPRRQLLRMRGPFYPLAVDNYAEVMALVAIVDLIEIAAIGAKIRSAASSAEKLFALADHTRP
ncbi:hypothetical protein EVAR_69387_1 [Eumeta japonica]|uniref:Uncharacterized protein n=1 Tax=Eumeta variegata TaxID=151549 RepID=A0A4C1ZZZ1_EUMVA|nr:hypothetical protein EVAR_69387_1 [Eumeta japonica]